MPKIRLAAAAVFLGWAGAFGCEAGATGVVFVMKTFSFSSSGVAIQAIAEMHRTDRCRWPQQECPYLPGHTLNFSKNAISGTLRTVLGCRDAASSSGRGSRPAR